VYILVLVLSIAMDLICIEYMGCDGTNIEKADENEMELENLREESVANGESHMRT
jgi:hypothetical protein